MVLDAILAKSNAPLVRRRSCILGLGLYKKLDWSRRHDSEERVTLKLLSGKTMRTIWYVLNLPSRNDGLDPATVVQ